MPALNMARSNGGESRRNVDKISGVIDSDRESPVFVIKAADGRMIGIEHSRVDQLSEKEEG